MKLQEIARYSRQMLLPGVGGKGQKRLQDSSVFVVGAGGLGCSILQYLTAAGVGKIGIADPDTIDISNLGRQVLYRTMDIGQPKVMVARQVLTDLNPHVEVETFPSRMDAENLGRCSKGYTLLIDGSDSYEAKFAVNDLSVQTNRPCVVGAAVGFSGQMMARKGEPDQPCYRCLFEEPPPVEIAQSCQDAGILGPMVGIIGSWQALSALELLLGLYKSKPGYGKLLQIDSREASSRWIEFRQRKGCMACNP